MPVVACGLLRFTARSRIGGACWPSSFRTWAVIGLIFTSGCKSFVTRSGASIVTSVTFCLFTVTVLFTTVMLFVTLVVVVLVLVLLVLLLRLSAVHPYCLG